MLRWSKCLVSICIAIVAACPLSGQVMDTSEQRPGGYGEPLVGASAARDAVRFVALTLAGSMRLEVLSATGETLYDSGFASGSRLEWQLRDQRGALLRDGLYGCIVTVQEPDGSWGYRRGVFRITQGMASFQETERSSPETSQALDRESLTILRAGERPAFTLLSHDGSEGWVESTSGGLSFYAGASSRERDSSPHLRVTPEGRVGIGVSEPEAKLDVAGLIRTSEGILFPDGTILRSAAGAGGFAVFAAGNPTKNGAVQKRMASSGGGFGPVYATEGAPNNFFGTMAGFSNTLGANNSFFGASAGQANTIGNNNSFFGTSTGFSNITGDHNSFFGYYAGQANTTGAYNSFFGSRSGNANITGNLNCFVGDYAGYANISGSYNSFVGSYAGQANTTGYDNSFFGHVAGYSNTTGYDNSFVGYYTGFFNTAGNYNSFFGRSAGLSNTGEHNNSFIGALSDGAAGITNATALGFRARVTASNSLVLGGANGVNGATADTFVGIGTTNPDRQLAVEGAQAIARFTRFYPVPDAFSATFGPALLFERARGTRAAPDNIGGGDYLGKLQFRGRVGGSMAEYGALTFIATDTSQNGRLAFVDRDLTTERFSILNSGNVGIGTTAPQERLHVVGNLHLTGLLLGPSDARLKRDIRDLRYGLREVLQLRPVSWLWENQPDARPGLGLIAQEVQSVIPELVERGKGEGDAMSLSYLGLVPVLVKAIQEQQEATATALERKDSEIALLKSRIAALEQWIERLARQEERREK